MTRPTQPSVPDVPDLPESSVSKLHALYQEAATAEPSLTLDRRILDAARAELRVDGAKKERRPAPWWKGWLPATSAIAVAAVGLSVTWRVMDEQERQLREEMRAEQVEGKRLGRAASAQRPAEARPSLNTQAADVGKSRHAEPAAVRDAPVGVPQPEAKPAPAVIAPAAASAAPAAPAASAPMVAEEVMKKSQRAEQDERRDRRDASPVKEAAPGPARQMGKHEAGGLAAGSSGEKGADALARPFAGSVAGAVPLSAAKSVAAPVADPATPEAWLKQIRELRDTGRSAEAAQSLARFRLRYPGFVLPDDLLNLK